MHLYRLSPHAHVCVRPEGAVFLDLKRDAYVAIDSTQARALSLFVAGWALSSEDKFVDPSEASAFSQLLCARGLLVPTAHPGRDARPPALAPAQEDLLDWEDVPDARLTPRRWWRFLTSVRFAQRLLKHQPLDAIVARYRTRRARADIPDKLSVPELTRDLLTAYCRMRLWFMSPKGQCLLDSLILLEFLSAYGIYANWVIGVRIKPFSAHSWIQQDGRVLNGTASYVRGFHPILVV